MKPCNFTTILPHSSSANNTDYKLPWKQVEFFVSELDFKLLATKNLSSFGGCNDWENLAVSQPLGGGASKHEVTLAFTLVGINAIFSSKRLPTTALL